MVRMLATGTRSYEARQRVTYIVFRDATVGACIQGFLPGAVAPICRQTDDTSAWIDGPDLKDRIQGAGRGEIKVEEDHVRPVLEIQIQSLSGRGRGAGQVKIVLQTHQEREAVAHQCIVIHHQDADRASVHGCPPG